MVVKLFQDHILSLEVHDFKGFLNRYNNEEMASNYSSSCNYVVAILKNPLILLNIVSNIAFDFSHTYR